MVRNYFLNLNHYLFLLLLVGVSGTLNAQMFEELKKEETVTDARVVVTVYSGIGLSMYSYDGNKPSLIGYDMRELRTGLSIPFNVNLLFRKNNLYFGQGIDYQQISIGEGIISADPLSVGIFKVAGRLEIQPKGGKHISTSGFLQAGPGVAINPPGTSASVLLGFNMGALWSVRVSQSAAMVIGASYGLDFFSNQVNMKDSRHRAFQFGLILGFRFGKKTT